MKRGVGAGVCKVFISNEKFVKKDGNVLGEVSKTF